MQSECKAYDFNLNAKLTTANDLQLSLDQYRENCPLSWKVFLQAICLSWKTSETVRRKANVIFQIVHNLVNDSLQKTLLHVALSQTIHDTCKSNRLVINVNRLGLCSSYHNLPWIAKHVIALAGPHRVPVTPSILPGYLIHEAMNKFDHEEHTLSGIGGSHDTILMLFQNNDNPSGDQEVAAFKNSIWADRKVQMSRRYHDCQRLKFGNRHSDQATIPSSFIPTLPIDWSNTIGTSDGLYRLWVLLRHTKDPDRIQNLSSFAATNSIVLCGEGNQATTCVAFTPIIPHPATDRNTITATVVNFQDVLSQKGLDYGPLWCDKVYRIAKKLQLQNSVQFGNIF